MQQLRIAYGQKGRCEMKLMRSKIARVAGLTAIAILVPIGAAGEGSNGVIPDDPLFPQQWTLHNTGQFGGTPGADIRALEAWEITTGDPNIVIAVLDQGVDRTHPDLIGNLVPGYDFVDDHDNPDPAPGDAHGTVCAGVAAAKGNNGIGLAGVAYDCKIMPVRTRNGFGIVSAAQDAAALRWAAAHGADVINYSWVRDDDSPLLRSALEDVTKIGGIGRNGRGCVVCFAAGNTGGRVIPSKGIPQAITVGATDNHDVRWSWSSHGPELALVAPTGSTTNTLTCWTTDLVGGSAFSSFNDDPKIRDYYQYMGGTSGSCPVVAGVAALILSVEPNLTCEEVRHYLCRSAHDLGEPGRDDYYGWGRVDARAALDMVLAKRCDLNNDGVVDEKDLAILEAAMVTQDLRADIAPAKKRDGKVDERDRELLLRYLGTRIPAMPEQEPGLIAHWALDEAEGQVARGEVEMYERVTPNGTVYGEAVWQPTGGRKGGALQLDGVDDYIQTPFVLNPPTGSFSVFVWVKGGSPGQVIVSQEQGANWLWADAATGALRTDLRQPGASGRLPKPAGPPLISSAVITDGKWHRVGFVWDGGQRILYVDGVEVARDMATGLEPSIGGLQIGTGNTLGAGTFWSGLIDEVRIYNRAVEP
jgi:hypothetical protein